MGFALGAGRARARRRGDAGGGQRRAAQRRRACAAATVDSAAELQAACERGVPACDVLLMAAAVADFRPRRRARGQDQEGAGATRLELELEPTDDVLAGLAARRRDGQTLVGFAAEHGDGAVELRAEARAQAPRRDRRQRHLARGHRLRRRRQRGHDPHAAPTDGAGRSRRDGDVPRARPRRGSREAILDASERLRASRVKVPADGDVYDLYQRGCELLEHGDHQAAIVPLSRARDLEPDKASIREALGRALFHAQRYEGAAAEFQAVVERARPTTTRCSASGARCSCSAATRGLPAARAGLLAAPRARGLPAVPRSRAARRQRARPERRASAQPARRCYARSTAFGRRARPVGSTESGRSPAFFA